MIGDRVFRNDTPDPIRVAIVSDSPSLRDLVAQISRDSGWIPVVIPAEAIEHGDSTNWNLAAIGPFERETDLLRLAASASRDAGYRVLAIVADADPQAIADFIALRGGIRHTLHRALLRDQISVSTT